MSFNLVTSTQANYQGDIKTAQGWRDEQIGLMMGLGNEPGRRLLIDPENIIYKYVVKRLQEDL